MTRKSLGRFSFLYMLLPRGCDEYHLSMTRIHPECPDSAAPDPLVAADVRLRQVPDEEEDEEEDRKKKEDDDDDDETDDGYSE
jgi:hypothetical protein